MDAEKPEENVIDEKKNASPLGRGADPGTSVEAGPIEGSGIAGQHGHQSGNAKGGPEGMIHRENEDMVQDKR